MSKSKTKASEKMIRIEAKSPYFEISETVPESKAVKRLQLIKENFSNMANRFMRSGKIETPFFDSYPKIEGGMKVTTSVINPTLF